MWNGLSRERLAWWMAWLSGRATDGAVLVEARRWWLLGREIVAVSRGRPGWVIGTSRRGGVDRLAATLMFAGRDRRSVMRRKVPLTSVVSGVAGGHRGDGDRSCNGGVPARRDDGSPPRADQR
jgi:hypothetical protein